MRYLPRISIHYDFSRVPSVPLISKNEIVVFWNVMISVCILRESQHSKKFFHGFTKNITFDFQCASYTEYRIVYVQFCRILSDMMAWTTTEKQEICILLKVELIFRQKCWAELKSFRKANCCVNALFDAYKHWLWFFSCP